MAEFTMTINGATAKGLKTIDVVNPATGEVFAQAPDCTPEQLDFAMTSAQEAFSIWKDDLALRRKVLYDCATTFEQAEQELAELATLEQGMPLTRGFYGVNLVARKLRHYADLEVPPVVIQDDEAAYIEAVRRPLGVIAAIKPWNAPLIMAVNCFAAAFRAGCTVILKPSPYTPLVTLRAGELLRDVVPPGVLNVISGADPLGQRMVEHPVPRGISFTGSVATGKKVNVSAAPDLKRVLLELGGNDPAIVLDDVDPRELADKLFWRAFQNTGQVCMAVKRVYVPEHLHDAVVEALAAKSREALVGNGLDDGINMGPLNNRAQFDRVKDLVAEAIASGATAVTGGSALEGPGYFYPPTILTGVGEGTRVVDEEQFGPVLPIMTYKTVAEAVARANATSYGLGSSVWSADPVRAQEVADKLESGTTWVNTHAAVGLDQPFQGTKSSGLGSENGLYGVNAYSEFHTVYHGRSGPTVYSTADSQK
jgi:acyl-CoA reductase-like NAD-dependent aldehyde dehydrogenase